MIYIDCVGMTRSGSTLQYNIVADVLELKGIGVRLGWEHYTKFQNIKDRSVTDKYNIFKNHFLTDEISNELEKHNNSRLMYVYRDIRDVCVSLMEKESKTFKQIFDSKALHKAINQYYVVMQSPIKKYVQSYEVMFFDTKQEIKNIASFFNEELSDKEIDALYNSVSFEAQKEKIEKYKIEKDYISSGNQNFNPETLLHTNHIKDGGVEKYKTVLKKEEIELLNNTFKEWLLENKYKIDNNQEKDQAKKTPKYYSQHGDDYLLSNFFDYKKDGIFVEVGAFDGIHLSNSYSFELVGWSGICIEPSKYYEYCEKNRPNSICLNIACVDNDDIDELTFYEEELGLLSTLTIDDKKEEDIEARYKNRGLEYKGTNQYKVKCKTLNKIFEENNICDIDFLSIDVEGTELNVLRGLDLSKYKPRVLVVEANDQKSEFEQIEYLTVDNDYIYARRLGANLFFVRNVKDLCKINSIKINCIIEKQIHPLGKAYTLESFGKGIEIANGNIINNSIAKEYEAALSSKEKEFEAALSSKEKEFEEKLSSKIKELDTIYKRMDFYKKNYNTVSNKILDLKSIKFTANPIRKYEAYKAMLHEYFIIEKKPFKPEEIYLLPTDDPVKHPDKKYFLSSKEQPILIYQVGKVGSSAIYVSLKKNIKNLPIYQVHNISTAQELLDKDLKNNNKASSNHLKMGILLKEKLDQKENIEWKIIIGVREPISRWISDVFENIHTRYKFLKDKDGIVNVDKTIDFIKETIREEPQEKWFKEELLATFGVNVFDVLFEENCQIAKMKNLNILFYKFETMREDIPVAINKFLNLKSFDLVDANVSAQKGTAKAYETIKRKLKFTEEFLDELYSQSIINHIYTKDEIQKFKKRWME